MPHEWSNALNYGNNSDTGGYMRRLQWSNELQEKRYRYLIMRNGYHTSGVFLRGYGWPLVVVIIHERVMIAWVPLVCWNCGLSSSLAVDAV